jgi:hypothetical protein
MANPNIEKTLREYSAPSTNQVPTGPEIKTRNGNFEIKTGLITMVHASPFCGKPNEDAVGFRIPTRGGGVNRRFKI